MKEIKAKTIISPFFGQSGDFKSYTYNPYRGCQHGCIYCDSRSLCYGIDDFEDISYKGNAIDLLKRELGRKTTKGIINTGSMSDPYMPAEEKLELTRRSLQVIADYRFGVQIITKSDLVTRDLGLLKRLSKTYCCIVFTLTTVDDPLARIVEPAAPLPSKRLQAMRTLFENGIDVGVAMMPILPFIQDNRENISSIVSAAAKAGAGFIYSSMGMTLRDRQREYYYSRLDESFPGLRERYERAFADAYSCRSPHSRILMNVLKNAAQDHGVSLRSFGELSRKPDFEDQIRLF